MSDKKRSKILTKQVAVKFKTKSGRVIAFKAIETSLKPSKEKTSSLENVSRKPPGRKKS